MVYVLGPTLDFYQAQIAHFNCTPAPAAPVVNERAVFHGHNIPSV